MRIRFLWVLLLTLLPTSAYAGKWEYEHAPHGFVAFCERGEAPELCENHVINGPTAADPTPEELSELDAVNRSVNRRIRPATDLNLYGVAEYWTIPDKAGDCEDYVLLKQRTLLGRGYSLRSLTITVVYDEDGEAHAILVFHTRSYDLVLDNKRGVIMPLHSSGYRVSLRQSTANPRVFIPVGKQAGTVAAQ